MAEIWLRKSVDQMPRYRHKPKAAKRNKPVVNPSVERSGKKFRADAGSLMMVAPFISALIAVYFGCVSIHALLKDQPVAHVGDILEIPIQTEFGAAIPPIPASVLATIWASPGRACSLDLRTIRKFGGSATVIALRTDGVMLEWVGRATAAGNGGCDTRQPILIKAGDYQKLVKLQAS